MTLNCYSQLLTWAGLKLKPNNINYLKLHFVHGRKCGQETHTLRAHRPPSIRCYCKKDPASAYQWGHSEYRWVPSKNDHLLPTEYPVKPPLVFCFIFLKIILASLVHRPLRHPCIPAKLDHHMVDASSRPPGNGHEAYVCSCDHSPGAGDCNLFNCTSPLGTNPGGGTRYLPSARAKELRDASSSRPSTYVLPLINSNSPLHRMLLVHNGKKRPASSMSIYDASAGISVIRVQLIGLYLQQLIHGAI
jgi:hypothetical protein